MRHIRNCALPVAMSLITLGTSACGVGLTGTTHAGSAPTGASHGTVLAAATPLPVPAAGPGIAVGGTGDVVYTITPQTYVSASGVCAIMGRDVAPRPAPFACSQAWRAVGFGDVPDGSMMNTMPMPRTITAAGDVSETDAIAAATAFYRWQAFETLAELNNVDTAMRVLAPPGHPDPVIAALGATTGARIGDVPPCALPVAIRVVHIDKTVRQYMTTLGWDDQSGLAIIATYPDCTGVTLTFPDGHTGIVGSNNAVSAINPGVVVSIPPFGEVWRIEGEAACGSADQLQAVCNGGG